ncbi:hypothetical protein [Mollivirus kamchatka]|nr:hypothetical protein [Mollivirus kamchatka]
MKRKADTKDETWARKSHRHEEVEIETEGYPELIPAIFSPNFSPTIGARLVEFLPPECLASLSSVSRDLRDSVLETARHVIVSKHLSAPLQLANGTSVAIRPTLGPGQRVGDFLAGLSELAREMRNIPAAFDEALDYMTQIIRGDECREKGVLSRGRLNCGCEEMDCCPRCEANPVFKVRRCLMISLERTIETGSGPHVRLWLTLHRDAFVRLHSADCNAIRTIKYWALHLPVVPAAAILAARSTFDDDRTIDILAHCFSAYAQFAAFESDAFDCQLQIVADTVATISKPDIISTVAPRFVARLVGWASGLRETLTRYVPVNYTWLQFFRQLEDAMVAFAPINRDIARTLADALLSLASWRGGAPDSERFCLAVLNTVDTVWFDNAQLLARLQAIVVGQPLVEFLKAASVIFNGSQHRALRTDAFMRTSTDFIDALVKARMESKGLDHQERQQIMFCVENMPIHVEA